MLEAFLLAGYVLVLSPLLYLLKIEPIWIFVGMLIISLPGIYAMVTGAPFVPTSKKVLRKMMTLAKLTKGQKVYDLGCGDGRLIFAASKEGANAVGYELSFPTYVLAKIKSLFFPGSKIQYKNFWTQDYKDADVIFCFLLKDTMQKFYKIVWPQLRPGCKVVSHAFKIDGLKPSDKIDSAVLYIK
ncbi:hypothetical protein COY06_04860 [Candidatus Peregrinibacteria bacterium CG_4_10_14_0_2_um_filter_41_8]|nr:MAG: hypothetical protein COY06_04860 [Candidatus Peregrinibacteria bacterium CG_4_10_14_0_2_um_filter_41_8]